MLSVIVARASLPPSAAIQVGVCPEGASGCAVPLHDASRVEAETLQATYHPLSAAADQVGHRTDNCTTAANPSYPSCHLSNSSNPGTIPLTAASEGALLLHPRDSDGRAAFKSLIGDEPESWWEYRRATAQSHSRTSHAPPPLLFSTACPDPTSAENTGRNAPEQAYCP